MSTIIKNIEKFLAKLTNQIVVFMKKVLINDTERLLKFVISVLLLFVIAWILKFPFILLEWAGSSIFGLISSSVVFRLFRGIWLILLMILYFMAIIYLFCLVVKRYFDKPKEKILKNVMEQIYTYYPTVIKIILWLIFIWLVLNFAIIVVCISAFGSLVLSGVHVAGCLIFFAGLFLILLYILDTLYLMIKKVGGK